MTPNQDKLLERARAALTELHLGVTDNAGAAIHDLIREVNRLQDIVDQSNEVALDKSL